MSGKSGASGVGERSGWLATLTTPVVEASSSPSLAPAA
jgi:hypothetical protein